MGGTQKHLNHLYDNHDLSFGKMKDILKLASAGKLKATEKIDGAQISLSFRDGQALYARNKTDLKNFGKNINDLVNRNFAGGDKVKDAYVDAFQSFAKAVKSFDRETINNIFENGTVFYSAEIFGPAFTNVINYDKNVINIHETGHIKVDPQTREITSYNNPNASRLLDKAIDAIEYKNNFSLQRGAFVKLKEISNKEDLKIVLSKINKLMNEYGLDDKNTIGDYLYNIIEKQVKERLPHINQDIQNVVINNLLGKTSLIGPGGLPKGLPREIKSEISNLKKSAPEIIKKAVSPLEMAIHDFSVELLKGLESVFILDNEKEQKRLQKEVETAIQKIQSSGNQDAIEILSYQLQKLKNAENISTALEGIVFEFDGDVYKFTGNFAPVNQILGLFRYGRGKSIPPMIKNEQLDEIDKKKLGGNAVAVIPGGFKPPHAGHYEMAEYFADKDFIDFVYIIISPKERTYHSYENVVSIDKDMSYDLWKLYVKDNQKIIPMISKNNSPVSAVYDFMEELESGDTMFLPTTEKDTDAKDTRFSKAQEWSDKKGFGISVKFVSIPYLAQGISATQMREAVAEGNKKSFFSGLPNHLSIQDKEKAWEIVGGQEKIKENYQDTIKRGHEEAKKKIIATGGHKKDATPFTQDPKTERSKSAPPGSGVLESADEQEQYYKVIDKIGYAVLNWKYERTIGSNTPKYKNYVAKILLQHQDLIRKLAPMPKKPKWLFRGMNRLNEIPEPGQLVLYTSKKTIASGWTPNINIAKKFCGSKWHSGIILAIDTNDIDDKQILFYPYSKDSKFAKMFEKDPFPKEQEWIIDTRKPLKVSAISFCDPEMLKQKHGPEAMARAKTLKRQLKEDEEAKMKKKIIATGGHKKDEPPFTEDPETKRDKSAPVGAGVLEDVDKQSAQEKLLYKDVKKIWKAINDWKSGYAKTPRQKNSVAKTLLQYQDLIKKLAPMPKKPKWLFRGMELLNKIPEPGQPILYTSKKSIASGWTPQLNTAKSFCGYSGDGGVILAVNTNDIDDKQILFYPYDKNSEFAKLAFLDPYPREKEWIIDTRKPLKVSAISFCDKDALENKHGPEAITRAKDLKRQLKEDEEEKMKKFDKDIDSRRQETDQKENNKPTFKRVSTDNSKQPLVLVDDDPVDFVEEMSSMSAGSVEGAVGNKKLSQIDKKQLTERVMNKLLTIIATEDKLKGGLGDEKQPSDFDADQIKKGIAVEMEHTDDPEVAKEIALDHLTEDPEYYDKLEKMEKEF